MTLLRKMCLIILLSIVASSVVYYFFGDMLPQGASKQEWELFIENAFQHNKSPVVVLGTLLTIHLVQILFCVPFVNITQTLYAYIFGFFTGTLVSFVWEFTIVSIYTVAVHSRFTYTDRDMARIVNYLQQQNVVMLFLVLLQSSSIPLNAQVLVIGYGNTTVRMFLSVYSGISMFNSIKNCLVGEFIRSSNMNRDANVEILSASIIFITTFPTVVSVFIWNGTYNFYNATEEHDGAECAVPEDLNDVQSDVSTEEHTVSYPSDAVHCSKADTVQENLTAPLGEHDNCVELLEHTHDDETVEVGLDLFAPIVPWKTYFFAVHPDAAFRYFQTYFMPASKNPKDDEEIHLIKSDGLKNVTDNEPELPDRITNPLHTHTSEPVVPIQTH